jgi:hypothetical protein
MVHRVDTGESEGYVGAGRLREGDVRLVDPVT